MAKFLYFIVLLVAVLSVPSTGALAKATPGARYEHVCPPKAGFMSCTSRRASQRFSADSVTGPAITGFGPADLQDAYKLTAAAATNGVGRTIAIVVAQDGPTAEADLAIYRSNCGLPPCTSANGCFRVINQLGASSPLPSADPGWATEINVQLQTISPVCPNCNLLVVEANSAISADLNVAVITAAAQSGVVAMSNPYGGGEDATVASDCETTFNHPGIAVTASAGDDGCGISYPASCHYVTAVGGTSLVRSTDALNARGWSETAWGSAANVDGGGGSGCSSYISKPSWQKDIGCTQRITTDVAALADPDTGPAIYDQGQWIMYGGTSVSVAVVRHGFYPRGGGEILAHVTPSAPLSPVSLMERGVRKGGYAEAHIAGIPMHVASRELEIVGKMLNWPAENLHIRGLSGEFGPGNALTITVEHEAITEVFTGFGEKGVSAESVAKRAVDGTRNYLASAAPVGPHLADQLLLPMGLAGSGEFATMPVTQHFESHVSIIGAFLDRRIGVSGQGNLMLVRIG